MKFLFFIIKKMLSQYRDNSKNVIKNLQISNSKSIPSKSSIDVKKDFIELVPESKRPPKVLDLLPVSRILKNRIVIEPEKIIKPKNIKQGFDESGKEGISYDKIKKQIEFSRLTPYEQAQVVLARQEQQKKIEEANVKPVEVQKPEVINIPAVNRPIPVAPPINPPKLLGKDNVSFFEVKPEPELRKMADKVIDKLREKANLAYDIGDKRTTANYNPLTYNTIEKFNELINQLGYVPLKVNESINMSEDLNLLERFVTKLEDISKKGTPALSSNKLKTLRERIDSAIMLNKPSMTPIKPASSSSSSSQITQL